MVEVNSKNRTAAKRLLNNWHDSRDVRTWALSRLTDELQTAVRNGLITQQGVERALAIEPEAPPKVERKAGDTDGDGESESGKAKDGESNGDAESKAEAEAKQADADGQSDGEAQSGKQSDAKAGGDASESKRQPSNAPSQPPPFDSQQPFVTHPEAEEMRQTDRQWVTGLTAAAMEEMAKHADVRFVEMQTKVDAAVEAASKVTASKPVTVEVKTETGTRTVEGAHERLPDVLRYVAAGLNVALVGPAGTGKSTIAHMVAKALEREFRGCGALLSKYDLTGFEDANGTYHETPLFDAYVNGHLFCFDELDASAAEAVVAFNGITDNQNVYAFPHGMHSKHENFVAVACMNTWGNGADADYVGRFKQDAASMSRFVRVYIDYDRKIEQQLGDADICERVWKLRDVVTSLGIRHVVSTRMIQQAQAARNAGANKTAIDRDILFSGLNDSAIMQIASAMRKGV